MTLRSLEYEYLTYRSSRIGKKLYFNLVSLLKQTVNIFTGDVPLSKVND